LLNIPKKLYPVILDTDSYDYFLIEGGRGSAKSQTIARVLLYVGSLGKLRIVCGREVQNTIQESVYALLKDLIDEFKLDYDVQAQRIIQRTTGTEIIFKGFREQGRINIKGLEGANILWVDEAQAIKSSTLKVIVPTIRKKNSKVFWTMNRYLFDDPVFKEFHARADCLTIHIDYFDNEFCPDKLKKEADTCKEKNIEDFDHIWLGQPLRQAQNAAFRNVAGIVDYDMDERAEPVPEFDYVLGVDLAKSVDFTELVVLCIQTKRLVYHECVENENRASWHYQKEKILALSKKYNDALTITDSTGVGDPITEDLQRMGVNVYVEQHEQKENPREVAGFKFTNLSKENLIEKLKVAIELQTFRIPYIKSLVDQLIRFECTRLPSGRVRYSAPDGSDELGNPIHYDDGVIALALAVWGSRDMIYSSEYTVSKPETPTDRLWNQVRHELTTKNFINNTMQDKNDVIEIEEEDAQEVI
jgi:PBSX family phage terminase large subunit